MNNCDKNQEKRKEFYRSSTVYFIGTQLFISWFGLVVRHMPKCPYQCPSQCAACLSNWAQENQKQQNQNISNKYGMKLWCFMCFQHWERESHNLCVCSHSFYSNSFHCTLTAIWIFNVIHVCRIWFFHSIEQAMSNGMHHEPHSIFFSAVINPSIWMK